MSLSYIFYNKENVITACKNIIAEIDLERKKLFEEKVESAIKRRWPFPNRTREEAERFVNRNIDFMEPFKWHAYGRRDAAEILLRACELDRDGIILLNTTDASFIKDYV